MRFFSGFVKETIGEFLFMPKFSESERSHSSDPGEQRGICVCCLVPLGSTRSLCKALKT